MRLVNIKRYAAAVLLALFAYACNAQRSLFADKAISKAFECVYNIDNESFVAQNALVKDEAMRRYLEEYMAVMNYTATNNKDNYNKYMTASDAALKVVDAHKYGHTLHCNLLLHRCLVEMSNGSLIGGGMQFWKAYREFKAGEKQYPEYEGQIMLRGIFNILLSQIPEKWKGIAGFLGFDGGDLAKGFECIEDYRRRMNGVPGAFNESLLLSFANIFLSHEQVVSDELANQMKLSQSPVVQYVYLLSMGRKYHGSEAEKVIAALPARFYNVFPLFYHQKAKFALRGLRTRDAIAAADDFIRVYDGMACRNDAYLIKAYAYLLDGNSAKANELAAQCVKLAAKSDVDKRTLADAERVPETDRTLLRARMQFEYGNFYESLSTLRSYKMPEQHRIEYIFRYARAQHLMGDVTHALANYDRAISWAANDKRYFGPYSAVYAADEMIKQNKLDAAKAYIKTARQLNNGEFSKEIDQRIALTTRQIDKMENQ
ncbi:MAG: hypothetical protein K6G73_13135 [Marinilabiliaceae bacterium]|nr:hypothetical protein [Marinilabiliaceae bacterium]